MTTILIADDHPIFCAGLRRLLDVEPEFEVVGEARDGLEAVALATGMRPDLVLLDLVMPRMAGLDVLHELTHRATRSRLIVLTAAISRPQIVEALRLGAHGVVLKDAASDLLFRAIRTVMSGQCWVGRESVGDLVRYIRRQDAPEDHRGPRLTAREQQVVAAVANGLSNKEIAHHFSLSQDTVKHHLSNVYDKLGVSNRLELALLAVERDLVDRRQPF